jgi:hypothetical protein
MKLIATFVTSESSINPIDFGHGDIGLDLVDLARNISGLPKLDISLFDEFIKPFSETVEIELDEQEARRSGLFNKNHTVFIEVPGEFLNKYTTISPMFYRDSKDGKITRVAFEYKIDKYAILVNWMSYGYPKTWGFNNDQNSEHGKSV